MEIYVVVHYEDLRVVGVFESISEITEEFGQFDHDIPSLKTGDTLLIDINGELHKIFYLLVNRIY